MGAAVVVAGTLALWLAARPAPVPSSPRTYPAPVCDAEAAAARDIDPGRTFAVGDARDLVREGRWLKDAQGRYVLLRGVNLASRSKRPPYLPVLPLERQDFDAASVSRELERLRPELCRLRDAGVNVIRLLVIWKAIEPEHLPHWAGLQPRGRAYLEAVRQVVDVLYREHGMFVVIDFHQDIVHEAYGGEGFPDWALAVDQEHPVPAGTPPPSAMWGTRYFPIVSNELSSGVRRTLQAFWRNRLTSTRAGLVDDPVRTHLARTIGLTAGLFRDHPGVLGFEPFNEPHQAGLPKDTFEREILAAFYGDVVAEVAKADPRAFVLLEPRLDWTTYPADAPEPTWWRPGTLLRFTSAPRSFLDLAAFGRDARVIFAFHYYDPWLVADLPLRRSVAARARTWPAMFAAMDAASRAQDAVPFLTEFGCSQDWTRPSDLEPETYGTVTRACIDRQYREVEAHLMNAAYWVHDFYGRRGADGKASENWNGENLSLLGPEGPRNIDLAARPYPMRSSMRPRSLVFDVGSGQAALILEGAAVDAPTVVYVPQRMHHPRGFDVRATSARPLEWDAGRQLLYWWPAAGAGSAQALIITPRGRFDGAALPADAVALAKDAPVQSFAQ